MVPSKPKDDVRCMRRAVSSIIKHTETVVHDAAFALHEEAVILIPAVRRASEQLQEVLGFFEEQAVEPVNTEAGSKEPLQAAI
jgi:hypothetical protein